MTIKLQAYLPLPYFKVLVLRLLLTLEGSAWTSSRSSCYLPSAGSKWSTVGELAPSLIQRENDGPHLIYVRNCLHHVLQYFPSKPPDLSRQRNFSHKILSKLWRKRFSTAA